ncbi:MAG TPA: hypothetical protein VMU50_10715 [Polyangia bacterium]|nr:hypothetical protein [Polyangia bacterium]
MTRSFHLATVFALAYLTSGSWLAGCGDSPGDGDAEQTAIAAKHACAGGPKFDAAGEKNVGNGVGRQFIGGQCLHAADCASGCCALPCGICSGPGAQFQAGKQGCGFGGFGDRKAARPPTDAAPPAVVDPAAPPAAVDAGQGKACVGGPKFDPAGEKNVGNGAGRQFIGGQCLGAADCASGCCALPCGICSGPGAQFQAGKQGCGFGGAKAHAP